MNELTQAGIETELAATQRPVQEPAPSSPRRVARLAGVFYLVVGIAGGFAEGFVDPSMFAAGNAAASTHNLLSHAPLVRLGVVAHLTDAVFFALVALTLYALLAHVNRYIARLMVTAVVVAATIISVCAVFSFVALQVATEPAYAHAFGAGGAKGVALLLLELEHYGVFAAQVFFGLWLAPLGYLASRSRLFPKPLGIVLIAATVSYLLDVAIEFLLPGIAAQTHGFFGVVPAVAEIWMVFYLLIIGVRTARSDR